MCKSAVVGICAVILIFAGSACRRSATYTTKDGSVTIQEHGKDAGSMTVSCKNGEKGGINMEGGKVPEDYPKDVPLYQAKVIMANSSSEKHTQHLMMESGDTPDKIAEFYKKGLDSNGWKTEGTMNMGEMNMFTASKGNRQLVIQISNGPDKRTISQILTDK